MVCIHVVTSHNFHLCPRPQCSRPFFLHGLSSKTVRPGPSLNTLLFIFLQLPLHQSRSKTHSERPPIQNRSFSLIIMHESIFINGTTALLSSSVHLTVTVPPSPRCSLSYMYAECYRLLPSHKSLMAHRKKEHHTDDDSNVITWN